MEELYSEFYQSFIYKDRWKLMLDGFLVTLLLSLSSFIAGTVIAFLTTWLYRKCQRTGRKIIDIIVGLVIKMPAVVLLMIFVYVLFADIPIDAVAVAIICFSLKTGADMTIMFLAGLDSLDAGQAEAARALGMSKTKTFLHITLPQATKAILPIYKTQFVTSLQQTSVVGYVAIQDITRSSEIIQSYTLSPLFTLVATSIVYILFGFIASAVLSLVGRSRHITPEEVKLL